MGVAEKTAAPLPAKLAGLVREAKWLGVVALALYLLLVFSTLHRPHPGWAHIASGAGGHNAGGLVGAVVADFLLYLFGVSAYWWVVLCLYLVVSGYRGLDGRRLVDRRPLAIAFAGFMLLLVSSAALEALRFHSLGVELSFAPGGVAGAAGGKVLAAGLGFTGATLLLLTLAAVGFSLFTGLSWLALSERVGHALEKGYALAVEAWDRRRDRKLGALAREERTLVVQTEKRREEDHPPLRIEPAIVEIKKSDRVQKEKQAPLFEELPDTPLPPLKLLDEARREGAEVGPETLEFTSRLIEKKLSDFGVAVKVLAAYPGPVITRYEVEPAVGVKGSQIVNLVKDLARALSVVSIRVVETIPGKSCMGLEIPNPHRQIVRLSEILGSEAYHALHSPLALVVIDMKQAVNALTWCVAEMDRRYKLMNWLGVRNLSGFNHKIAEAEKQGRKLENPFMLESAEPQPLAPLPHLVLVIDELADLMMVVGKKVEELIARLAQKARAAGIHLILATQRPSVDVITGLIKANIPTRIAFQVSSKVDSRTILDQSGAEALLGSGDMLYLPPGAGLPQRVHGAFVADHEVHKVVEHLKSLAKPEYLEEVLEAASPEDSPGNSSGEPTGEKDPLSDQAVEIGGPISP